MPLANQSREQFYNSCGTTYARFAHYTSAEAALKIIEQKRLWMRSTACMVDYQEVQHGYKILRNSFAKEDNAKTFIAEMDKIASGAAVQAINNFDGWWKSGALSFNTFITSVSEHDKDEDFHGRLSMWRAFGANFPRVAIVLNIPKHSPSGEALNLKFSPVLYLTEEQSLELIPQVTHQITANSEYLKGVPRDELEGWIFSMLVLGTTCNKHEGFREEREWRAVHYPQFWQAPLVESSTETICGVPQIVYKIPLDAAKYPALDALDFSKIFERLIIGPSQFPMAMRDAFSLALTKAGVTEAGKRIFNSAIPIRS